MGPKQRKPGTPRSRGRAGRGDAAVSPIIGTILVLAISVLGIVAVSNWGLPAIEAMQSGVQQRSALEQFRNLDATMQELVSGTAGQTTFKWQPQVTSGAIDVNDSAERWFVAGDMKSPGITFYWKGLGDRDDTFWIYPSGVTSLTTHVHVWQWTGGSKVELLAVPPLGGCTPFTSSLLPAGQQLSLRTNATSGCQAVNIANTVLTFQVTDEPLLGAVTTYAVGYLADVGRVNWVNTRGFVAQHVLDSNGAILTGPIDQLVVQSLLGVPAPRDFTNSTGAAATSVFVRLVKLSGNASFSAVDGAAQHAVYLNLVGSYTLGNTDSMGACSVYVWGDTQRAVYNALNSTSDGYRFTPTTANGEVLERYVESTRALNLAVVYSLVAVED